MRLIDSSTQMHKKRNLWNKLKRKNKQEKEGSRERYKIWKSSARICTIKGVLLAVSLMKSRSSTNKKTKKIKTPTTFCLSTSPASCTTMNVSRHKLQSHPFYQQMIQVLREDSQHYFIFKITAIVAGEHRGSTNPCCCHCKCSYSAARQAKAAIVSSAVSEHTNVCCSSSCSSF